jgi:hypothetical protein
MRVPTAINATAWEARDAHELWRIRMDRDQNFPDVFCGHAVNSAPILCTLMNMLMNCLLGGICGWFDKVSGHPCGRFLTEALAFSCFNLPL